MNLIEQIEPRLKDLEGEYRQHYLKTDARQVFVFAILATAANIVFTFVEAWLYFPQPRFYALLIFRISYFCFTAYFRECPKEWAKIVG